MADQKGKIQNFNPSQILQYISFVDARIKTGISMKIWIDDNHAGAGEKHLIMATQTLRLQKKNHEWTSEIKWTNPFKRFQLQFSFLQCVWIEFLSKSDKEYFFYNL